MKKFLLFVFTISLLISSISFPQESFETGKYRVRVDAYGAIRLFTTNAPDTIRHFDRISILVGGNQYEVMDYYQDVDIEIPTTLVASPSLSDEEISGTYNNVFSGLPPNVLLEQNVYGWQGVEYFIFKQVVTNKETSALVVKNGLDIIPRVDGTYENEIIYYDPVNEMIVSAENTWIGFKALSEPFTNVNIFVWFAEYTDSDTLYYNWLTTGGFPTDTLLADADGGVMIAGTAGANLAPNQSKTYYFAVATGNSKTALIDNMNLAKQKYSTLTSLERENYLPKTYSLSQNFPNPFNPETSIKFSIPEREFVSLRIYNSLGQEVANSVNQEMEAGSYNLKFDGADLSSGIYLYTIKAGNFVQTKKMILMK